MSRCRSLITSHRTVTLTLFVIAVVGLLLSATTVAARDNPTAIIGPRAPEAKPQFTPSSQISCVGVLHRMGTVPMTCSGEEAYVSSGGYDQSEYIVEYRLRECGLEDVWTDWMSPWDEDPIYYCDYGADKIHTYRYISVPEDYGVYCTAEWRVQTISHDGQSCCENYSAVYATSEANQYASLQSNPCTGVPSITFVVPYTHQ